MKTQPYTVRRIVQETSDVRSYILEFGDHPFSFTPGQFVIFNLNANQQAPLTISSSPHDQKYFQVTVKRIGNFGTQFYDNVQIGDTLYASEPMGQFKLQTENLDPICFIGRDYCITAARSFFYYLLIQQPQRRMTLFHEISDPDQILYQNEFKFFEQNSPLTRILILDQPNRPAGWNGGLGRLTPIMLRSLYLENTNTKFFAAGEHAEIKFYQQLFQSAEIPKQNIAVERWS